MSFSISLPPISCKLMKCIAKYIKAQINDDDEKQYRMMVTLIKVRDSVSMHGQQQQQMNAAKQSNNTHEAGD